MKINRRHFLKSTVTGAAVAGLPITGCDSHSSSTNYDQLDKILAKPVLKKEIFSDPATIDSLELLRYQNNFICRVRSSEGAEGISISNNDQMRSLYPIFTNRLQPFFIGKDARDLDRLIKEVYVYRSNYKLQNLALWVPLATIEFAILDLLGKIAGQSIGNLIGDIHNPEIAVYQANNFRGKTAEESIDLIKQDVEETKANALNLINS